LIDSHYSKSHLSMSFPPCCDHLHPQSRTVIITRQERWHPFYGR